jgi:hypothetical protein
MRRHRWLRACTLAAACVLSAACSEARGGGAAAPLRTRLVASVVDTLTTGGNPLLADPIGVYVDPAGRFVAVDRSDKMLKVYDRAGTFLFSAGRAGPGPGEFGALWGGGSLRDSIFGYDFTKVSVAVFAPDGRYVRSFPIRRPGEGLPAAIHPVDDSLLLVVGFAIDSWRRELLSLVRRDGTVRSRFFNLSAYFSPGDPALLMKSIVVADAGGGVVVAGMRGSDSLWVFDYDGRLLASARIVLDGKRPLRTYRSLIEANRGKLERPDGTLVVDGEPALVALVAGTGGQAMLQVMSIGKADRPWPDLTEGGHFLVARVDRGRGTLSMGADTTLTQGLLGRDRAGNPLTFRYLGAQFDAVELSRLTLADAPGGGGR